MLHAPRRRAARITPLTLLVGGMLAAWAVFNTPQVQAAQASPPRYKAATGSPAARASGQPAADKSGRKAKPAGRVIRPARVPAATLPASVDTRLQAGCLDEPRMAYLATQLALDAQGIESLRVRADAAPVGHAAGRTAHCHRFTAALGEDGGASALAILDDAPGAGVRQVLVLARASAQEPLRSLSVDLPDPGLEHRDIRLPAVDLESMAPQDLAQIPPHLRWEAGQMVRRMVGGLGLPAAHELRLVFDRPGGSDREILTALELIETASGRMVDGVIWMDRPDGPGTYIGLAGIDHERLLWQSPVRYERITRGVGPSSTTLRRPVAAKAAKGGKPGKVTMRTYQYRGQHIGVDFAGPVGTPIHTVAPGEVAFAGTRGRYGKLLIIDHGTGHQTYYAHLSGFAPGMEPGRKVLRGEEIGYLGNTGFSTGPHLHFEVRKDGEYVDPFEAQGQLDFWSLQPQEQPRLLARWLALELSRRPPARLAQADASPPALPRLLPLP